MKFTDYKEKKSHGSPDFPIQYYFVDKNHSQYIMPLHWHRELEIIRILSGKLTVYINNMEYTASAGDIIFVGSSALHRAEPVNCIYECAVYDINMLRRLGNARVTELIMPLILDKSEIEPFLSGSHNTLTSTVGALFSALKSEALYYELEVYSLISKILYLLYTENRINEHKKSKRTARQNEVITAVIEYIEGNYTEKITLKKLAELTQTNEKYLCRFFKEFTGLTPTDYINRTRIEHACYEMTANEKSVTVAALDSGFNELSYFSKTFKKYKAITPREYAAQYKK